MAKAKKRKAKARPRAKRAKTTSGKRFRAKIAALCPNYLIDEDGDGQIVIYTGLMDDGDDNYVLFDDESGMAWKDGAQYEPGS